MNTADKRGRTARQILTCILLMTLGFSMTGMAAEPSAASVSAMPTVLITGANRGIGFEFVRQYTEKGFRVIAACRNPSDADDLNAFAAQHGTVTVEPLDLLDLEGIDALARRYQGQTIDLLINNAALMSGPDKGQTFGSLDYVEFDRYFHTNVRGPLKVTEAFWPNLKASGGTAALLTTGQGPRGIPVPGFSYYKASKAAIDNFQLDIGRQGRRDGVKVLILMPGRVPTHGEKPNPTYVPVEESVTGMIAVIENQSIEANGQTFTWKDGLPAD